MQPIAHNVALHNHLRQRLQEMHPEFGEDAQALIDTLDGVSDLKDKLIALMREADEAAAMARGLKGRLETMGERRARLERKAEKINALVLWAMQEAGEPKIQAPEFTLSVARTPKAVVVSDPSRLPARCVRTTITKEPDKIAIRELLDAGLEVPGASLSNGGVRLNVRKV